MTKNVCDSTSKEQLKMLKYSLENYRLILDYNEITDVKKKKKNQNRKFSSETFSLIHFGG